MQILGKQIPVRLIIIYVLALLVICAWPFMAFGSIFLFDAPGSSQQAGTYVALAILIGYPIIPVAGVLGSYFAYRGERKPLAYALAAIAVLPTAFLFVSLLASQVYGVLLSLSPSLLRSTIQ